MRRLLVLVLLILACPCYAQELNLLAGAMRDSASQQSSYAWALDYRHGLGENLDFTLSWLNEGHVTDHHRDGQSAQLWGRTNVWDRHLSLAVGAGPYRYYDTTGATTGTGFTDAHGWGGIFSVAATYYTDGPWLFELRANRVITHDSIDTTSVLAGVGYQLERPPTPGPYAVAPHQTENTTPGSELTVLVGQTIVNSFQSDRNTAQAIEYRRGVSTHLDWTLSLLNEGDNRLIRRNGLITQLWLAHAYFNDRLALSAGVGPYFAIDKRRPPVAGEATNVPVSAMVTVSAALRLSSRWSLRTEWDRVASHYNRDADVVLAGLGYRF